MQSQPPVSEPSKETSFLGRDCPNCAKIGVKTDVWYLENWIASCTTCGYKIDTKQLAETYRQHDPVSYPSHYTSHPSGIECIQITEHMNFCLGNATKYIWRADLKADAIEDLEKARWYIDREITRRKALQSGTTLGKAGDTQYTQP